jgi:hypothetical protein
MEAMPAVSSSVEKIPQIPPISLAPRPQTIPHPDKCAKLKNDAICGLSGTPEYVTAHFTWHRFAAIQIWIFVLFLVYTSIIELNAVLGGGRLGKIFFARRSTESLRNAKAVVTE